MRRFMLTNRIGFDLRNAVENPSFTRSIIKVLDTDGTVLYEIPWNPVTNYMYDPVPDPRYRKPTTIKMQTGEIKFNAPVPEDSVTSGENPFVQIIYRFVKKQSHTFEEIYRHLLHEKNIITPDMKQIIKNMIHEMYTGDTLGGLLIKRKENYIAGVDIEQGNQLIKIHNGYDPFEYVILTHVKNMGTVSRDELYQLLSFSGNQYQWARKDKTIDYYITKLLKEKHLISMGKDWYRFHTYPERRM